MLLLHLRGNTGSRLGLPHGRPEGGHLLAAEHLAAARPRHGRQGLPQRGLALGQRGQLSRALKLVVAAGELELGVMIGLEGCHPAEAGGGRSGRRRSEGAMGLAADVLHLAVLHPAVPQRLGRGHARCRIHRQQRSDEVLCLSGQIAKALAEDGSPVRSPAEQLAREQRVRCRADAPEVNLACVGPLLYLGRHVADSAAESSQRLHAFLPGCAETEVDELDPVLVAALIDDVLQLDVAVHQALPMHVVDGL
mmetsp:Transcript_7540/g.16100  ORF Transcript_7540/g.16100 Transcript_7540/m.16100 type:complete len:251 (+) Transcript_7540:207-959(+)